MFYFVSADHLKVLTSNTGQCFVYKVLVADLSNIIPDFYTGRYFISEFSAPATGSYLEPSQFSRRTPVPYLETPELSGLANRPNPGPSEFSKPASGPGPYPLEFCPQTHNTFLRIILILSSY
jgi:hypothetical protein